MKAVRLLTYATIGLAAGALAAGFAPVGAWEWVAGLAALAALVALWVLAEWQRREWLAALAFAACTGLAAVGMWLALAALWMVAGMVLGFSAWSLGAFGRRLAGGGRLADERAQVRAFGVRLLAVDALSLALAAAALRVRTNLSFALALLLGGLLVYGLSRIVGRLRS